jgi:hypothetical protein
MGKQTKHPDTLDIRHKAAHFDEPNILSQKVFYAHVRDGYAWLNSGVTLLRAAHALVEQCKKDDIDNVAGGRAWLPQRVHLVAVMNAAFAVENALKGVILCTQGVVPGDATEKDRDRIPKNAQGHILSVLAREAGFVPTIEHERNAIEYGHKYTTWLGRYPVTLLSSEWSGFSMTNAYALVDAYTSIFFQLVEMVSRREYLCGRGGDATGKTQDEYAAAEVARYRGIAAL